MKPSSIIKKFSKFSRKKVKPSNKLPTRKLPKPKISVAMPSAGLTGFGKRGSK